MRILELGNYIVPAYAGMLLAEQGHAVTKWVRGRTDPIFRLKSGDDMWAWLNKNKRLEERHPRNVFEMLATNEIDVVIDNFRPSTLARWGVSPETLAETYRVRWVSMRSESDDEASFDLVAQSRSWMEYAPWVPFYAGDTCGGLWVAFKAVASREHGHFQIGHASCMQKLVEGELILDRPQSEGPGVCWDEDAYYFDHETREAVVEHRDDVYREPVRDRAWKLRNLWHRNGRIVI